MISKGISLSPQNLTSLRYAWSRVGFLHDTSSACWNKLHLPASLQDEADEEPEALDAEAEQDDTDGEPISEGRDEL